MRIRFTINDMKELDILRDIERKVSRLDAIFREVIEFSNSFILRWNESGISFVNKHTLDFFGYTEDELLGKSAAILLPESDSAGRDMKSLAGDILHRPGDYASGQNENIKKNGERVWVAWTNKVVTDEDGVAEVLSIGNDITPVKDTERRLRRREDEFRTLVNNSLNIITRWDKDFRFLYANPRISSVRGYPPEYYIGKTISDLDLPDGAALMRMIREVFDTGEMRCLELTHNTPRGVMIVETLLVPELNDGESTVMGVGTDITDRKKVQQVLEHDLHEMESALDDRTRSLVKAEHELEQARRLSDLGQFTATIAHELRNPLASIQMAAFNIRHKVPDGTIARHLKTIDSKIEESNQIINDVLAYGRVRPPAFQKASIDVIMRECLAEMGAKVCATKVSVTTDFNGLQGITVEVDPLQIKEVFVNLIDNACDALKGITGRNGVIEIKGSVADGKAHISLADNGAGMSEEILRKLMTPFFTTKSQGTGLGLTISKQIVGIHGGEITVESQPDKGTTVFIILPITH